MSTQIAKARTMSLPLRLAAAALVAGTVPLLSALPASAANPVPYTDFAAKGSVGLCDKSGHAVTSGRITDRPFAWFAVSSTAAPPGYGGTGRKATLIIYQPRPNTYPNQWSGDQMTSSSPYTNPRYPMAAATDVDFTLKDYIAEFPPMWNGLLQLRMYYGIPGKPTWTETYAATDIKVTGSTWRVVRGASVPCTKGSAKPNEPYRITPSPSSAGAGPTATSTPSPVATAAPSTSATASVEPSADASGSGSPSPGSLAAGQVDAGSGAAPWLLGLGALVALLGGGAWWYLRRPGTSESP